MWVQVIELEDQRWSRYMRTQESLVYIYSVEKPELQVDQESDNLKLNYFV